MSIFNTAEINRLRKLISGMDPNANNYVHPDHTGDVTSTSDGATVITDGAVTAVKLDPNVNILFQDTILSSADAANSAAAAASYVVPSVENFVDGIGFIAGTTLSIVLSATLANENFLEVIFDGVVQHHDTYSIAGSPSTITFSSAIPLGTSSIECRYGVRAGTVPFSNVDSTPITTVGYGITNGLILDAIDQGVASTDSPSFAGLTVGDLIVNGTTFTVNSTTVTTADNLIHINYGEVGTGVTAGTAGLQVDRGTATDYQFMFRESDNSFVIGEIGSLQVVATREDTPTDNGLAYWDTATSKFVTDGPTWDGSTFSTTGAVSANSLTSVEPIVIQATGTYAAGLDLQGYGGTDDWLVQNNSGALRLRNSTTGVDVLTLSAAGSAAFTGAVTMVTAGSAVPLYPQQTGNHAALYIQQTGGAAFTGSNGLAALDVNTAVGSTGIAARIRNGGTGYSFVVDEDFKVASTPSAVNAWQFQGEATGGGGAYALVVGSDVNAAGRFYTKGSGNLLLGTGGTSAVQFVVSHTTSAVNYEVVGGAATGGYPQNYVTGTDADVGRFIDTKGGGTTQFRTNVLGGAVAQFQITHTASAVNRLSVSGSTTGAHPILSAEGSDANINLALRPKGSGVVRFEYASGVATTPANFSATKYITVQDSSGTTLYIPCHTAVW